MIGSDFDSILKKSNDGKLHDTVDDRHKRTFCYTRLRCPHTLMNMP